MQLVLDRIVSVLLMSTGTGKGGESIWGEPFEDEFVESLSVCGLLLLFYLCCV